MRSVGPQQEGCKEPVRSLNITKPKMKRRSSKKSGECSGSVRYDDGPGIRAAFTENMNSSQSSVVRLGQVILE